jgi:hypothetical protein
MEREYGVDRISDMVYLISGDAIQAIPEDDRWLLSERCDEVRGTLGLCATVAG